MKHLLMLIKLTVFIILSSKISNSLLLSDNYINFNSVEELTCHQDEDIFIVIDIPMPYDVTLSTGICCSIIDSYDYNIRQFYLRGEAIKVGAPQKMIYTIRCHEPQNCMIENKMIYVPNQSVFSTIFKKITVLPEN